MFDFSLINGLKVGIEQITATVCEAEDEHSDPEFYEAASIQVHLGLFTITYIFL